MSYKKIKSGFYQDSTLNVAKNLLGTYLVHESEFGTTIGKIVETEAYLSNDPACHASRGQTKRNAQMFGPAGYAYVYFIYGMYECFNVVTCDEGIGEAVLIRALEPVEGIELMEKRRLAFRQSKTTMNVHQLCNGPSKLVIAMGLSRIHNGINLMDSSLYVAKKDSNKTEIITTTRIGISAGVSLPYRFYLKDNKFVSKK